MKINKVTKILMYATDYTHFSTISNQVKNTDDQSSKVLLTCIYFYFILFLFFEGAPDVSMAQWHNGQSKPAVRS